MVLLLLSASLASSSLTLDTLRNDPKLTPQRFARYFRDFRCVFHVEVQEPEVFLVTQSGDCDDYATVADLVLREKGFKTRLIGIRMPGITHVVCYVDDCGCYLDFNNRSYLIGSTRCQGALEAIANKVARTFGATWTTAYEFTYRDGMKKIVKVVTRGA